MAVSTFADTRAQQTFVVPAGVNYIKANLQGAAGSSLDFTTSGNRGGYGAIVSSVHKVTPGETLYVNVGHTATSPTDTVDGRSSSLVFGGGGGADQPGTYFNHGGGASDIRQGGTALTNRIVVAGGGGGAALNDGGFGYNGGDATLANKNQTYTNAGNAYGGGPGTQSAGGAAGPINPAGGAALAGSAGSLGSGGPSTTAYTSASSSGGGGYYGGGSGSNYDSGPGGRTGYSGGGGSSRVIVGSLLATSFPTAVATGSVSIDTAYTPASPNYSPLTTTSQARIPFGIDIFELHPSSTGTRTITYQVSQDSTFATGVITGTFNFAQGTMYGSLPSDPAVSYPNPTATQMGFWVQLNAQGTWYMRVKTGGTESLPDSAWAVSVAFTSTHVPGTSIISPTGGVYKQYATNIGFQFAATDPWSGDSISAYQLVVENNTTGASIYDSGKQPFTTSLALGNITVNVALSTAAKDILLRWKVRVWDSTDTPSVYSGYSTFYVVDPPTVAITSPTAGGTVGTGAPTVAWTATESLSRTPQTTVVTIREQSTNTVVWSTTLTGAVYSATPPTTVLVNQVNYSVEVDVTDSVGLTGTAINLFTTSYVSPDPILYTVDNTLINTQGYGYTEVNWINQAPDPRLVAWRVYRRELPSTTWVLQKEIVDTNVKLWRDYLVKAGTSYMYTVTQVADRSGILLESPVGTRATGTGTPVPSQAEAQINFMEIDNYWIICTDDPTLTTLIPIVTGNSETEEYDTADFNIVGRGRHRDYGDRLGYTGSIVAEIRTPERVSSVRAAVEKLRAAQRTYYLRTPFGRLFTVAIGNLGWEPIAGAGLMEMGNLTIPWIEVA